MEDYTLAYTEAEQQNTLYFRASEVVAKALAAALPGAGVTDVVLSSQKVVSKEVKVAVTK